MYKYITLQWIKINIYLHHDISNDSLNNYPFSMDRDKLKQKMIMISKA